MVHQQWTEHVYRIEEFHLVQHGQIIFANIFEEEPFGLRLPEDCDVTVEWLQSNGCTVSVLQHQ